jgi:2,4-dienoyl-CoA reductase-like NADH-dependent reductase (Old Yellow Enzyme family)
MVLYGHAGPEGLVTQAHVDHYQALAHGGAGLIIQEATCVLPGGRLRMDQLGIWSGDHIPGLRRIAEAAHRENCPIFVQLHHGGIMSTGPEFLCPSAYQMGHRQGREMTVEEIVEVTAAFVQAGIRAYEAGYDGVELHGCHSYLLCQFLNRQVNRRPDKYGQRPVEWLGEIAAEIRENTSPEFVIGIRLGAFEPTLQDGIDHAKSLEIQGFQFLDISYGFAGEMDTAAPGDLVLADTVRGADAIAQAVNVPVFAVGHLRLPADAALALRETNVDMLAVGRSHLVDPAWTSKALSGAVPGKCLDCKTCQWRIDSAKCPGRLK